MPACVSAPVPDMMPANVKASERLKASVPLLLMHVTGDRACGSTVAEL